MRDQIRRRAACLRYDVSGQPFSLLPRGISFENATPEDHVLSDL